MTKKDYNRQWMATNAKNPVTIEHVTERVLERFWAKVDKTDTCWNWTGAKTAQRKDRPQASATKGYGYFNIQGRPFYAHRLSYLIANGTLTDGLVIDHLCNNTLCVRPDHLNETTNRENSIRSPKHSSNVEGGYNSRSICKYGHEREANSGKPCQVCYPRSPKAKDTCKHGHHKPYSGTCKVCWSPERMRAYQRERYARLKGVN